MTREIGAIGRREKLRYDPPNARIRSRKMGSFLKGTKYPIIFFALVSDSLGGFVSLRLAKGSVNIVG